MEETYQPPNEPDVSYILNNSAALEPIKLESGAFTFKGLHDILEKLYNEMIPLNEVPILLFLESYKEISKLFDVLGKVFYFVKVDVDGKVKMVEDMYIKNTSVPKMNTVEDIIRYEVQNNITESLYRSNGSRTILRLVRALDFVATFMQDIKTDPNLLLKDAVQRAYDVKLSPFHTWPVRKAVGLATFTLPNRSEFLTQIGAGGENMLEPYDELVKYLKTTADMANRTYTQFKLQDLP